jgi:processive 1,2-diacylglycerol beta-glucosyltransferase
MKRVLILTAGYGEGHNSAARALKSAFDEQPGVQAELVDLFALHAPHIDRFSRKAYIRVINQAPRTWSGFYRWLDQTRCAPWIFRSMLGHRRRLARLLAEKKPDALVSTYPVYAWLLQQLRAEGRPVPPLHTVVTDAITINSLWYRAPSDNWFVTDGDSAAFLHHHGIPPARVHVSGFPVALAFADRPARLQPPESSQPPRWRVLYMINSSRSRARETARALLQHPEWRITFTAGRDAQLREEIETMARQSPAQAEVHGWTDKIPELLMTHHVVISKAGGATTQESINALCPMLVNQVVPGQEEGNYELLRRHEAGALAETPKALIETLQRAFADDAALWRRWRANLGRLARPAAAREIAAHVLENCDAPQVISA